MQEVLEDVHGVKVSIETLRKTFINPHVSTPEQIAEMKNILQKRTNKRIDRSDINELIEDGLSSREIAERLSLSLSTIKRAREEKRQRELCEASPY